MEAQEIRILAEPQTDTCCRFNVDRPIYPEASFYFGNPEKAQKSPLAKRLFDLPGVAAVLLSHDQVTVHQHAPDPWQVLGPQIGAAIREHVQSGEPAVDESVRAALLAADEIRSKVEEVLEREINPAVAAHGGVVNLIDVRANDIFIKMGGGCQGCGMASVTLKQGVETAIRRAVPDVGGIFDTTDHAAGRNPYFAP